MKILLVNKFHYLKGGSEKYYFELGRMLKSKGHEVAYFSMDDEKNVKTYDKEYFVSKIDLNNGSKLQALAVIYSKKNEEKMIEALDDFKPDIVHLNNFQRQLSSSIIKPIKERNIPIVFTAHDVQAICPAITMLDNDLNICELCTNGKYLNCVRKKCIKNSKMKSLLGAVEGYYYRNKKIYKDKIDCIITPSEFYREKFIKDGINKNKIVTIHNSIDVAKYNVKTFDEGYALYFGRLSKEKGILNLMKAFSRQKKGKLYIAGEGPERENIARFIEENKLQSKIKLLGFLNEEQIKEQISKCKFVVIPSIWYENCPYSILETLAVGKPIIGSNMGGVPELVNDGENGYIYKFDDINELSEKMNILFTNDELVTNFSKKSKQLATSLYNKEEYYKKLITIYNDIKKKNIL